jgi:prepilin-type N-terminal cleavage/methylation domain-containing protein
MNLRQFKARAFTLVEIMVTVAVIGVAGAGIFEVLRTGTILFGKNTSINLSHSESRYGLLQLQNDLTSAVSTPLLTGSGTPTIVSGTISTSGTTNGPAAGVYFQEYAAGPLCLASSGTTATTLPIITGTTFTALPGQVIHIEATPLITTSTNSLLEAPISAVTRSGTTSTVTITNTLQNFALTDPISGTPLHVACFFTTPVVYVVQNGQLVRYTLDPAGTGTMIPKVLVNNFSVTSPTPFTMPSVDNSPDNTFLDVTGFTSIDASSNHQLYHGVTTPFTLRIPHFTQLTIQY